MSNDEESGMQKHARWLRRFHSAPEAATRLVCLPHAGGTASFFHPFSATLSPGIDVVAVQYPGRQDRFQEPGETDLTELAADVFDALATDGHMPTALLGHSMGATVGFELARLMERSGQEPLRLFASARTAPHCGRSTGHMLDDEHLIAEIRALGGTDEQFLADEELLALTLPSLRADYRAVDSYRYRASGPLDCPISVLFGDADVKVSRNEADEWGRHTQRSFGVTPFPGGHFYLIDQRRAVIEQIRRELQSDLRDLVYR
jgi:pyochelin biosynthetic protein PchC